MAVRYPLPYGFARTQAFLLEDSGGTRTLWHSSTPNANALGEVMRKYSAIGSPLALQTLDSTALAQRISAAYAEKKTIFSPTTSSEKNPKLLK